MVKGGCSSRMRVCSARALWEFGQARGVSLLALNLQYCLREPRITATLVCASTPEQIEADVAAMLLPVPDAVWADLNAEFGL